MRIIQIRRRSPINVLQVETFLRYQKMAFSVAKKFSLQYNRPYHEMVDEALRAMSLEISARWSVFDPAKSQMITWLYQAVYWGLKTYCLQIVKRREVGLNESMDSSAKPSWLETLLKEVGEEGKALVQAILEAPQDLADELSPRAPVHARKALLQHLREVRAWDEDRITRAWNQVEFCIAD